MKIIGVLGAFFAICVAVSSGTNCWSEDVTVSNLRKLAMANNELAFNLHRILTYEMSGNVFFSPLSISAAFGMLFYGARGETAKELENALGYKKAELIGDVVHSTFNRYFSDVLKSGNSSHGYVLNSANAILADKSLELLEVYRNNVEELYDAAIGNVDFSKDAPKIAEEINDWVKEKTNGKIKKLFDKLSPATVLVLLNAVYFKGAWKNPFDPKKTTDDVFYNGGLLSGAKNVPMMRIEGDFPAAFFENFQALELPYEGENVSMLILLPDKRDGLEAIEDRLTPKKLARILNRLYPFKMEFSVPKFKLEFKEELSRPLQTLGVNQIFKAGANFSGMTPSEGVSLTKVLHKAVIEVNEKGSEASAVTGILKFKSSPFTFKVDHPFLFAIVEKGSKSNMVLFLGRVNHL